MAWSSKIDKGQAAVPSRKKLTFSKLWRHKNRINSRKTSSHKHKNKRENLLSLNPLESHRPRAPPKDQAARVVARLPIIMEPWDSLICRSKKRVRRRRNHLSQIRKRSRIILMQSKIVTTPASWTPSLTSHPQSQTKNSRENRASWMKKKGGNTSRQWGQKRKLVRRRKRLRD